MLAASANAVGGQVDVSAPGTHSRKVVENLRALSAIVTEAVCAAAVADGVTTVTHGDVAAAIQRVMWMPVPKRAAVLDDSLHAGDGPAPSIQDRPIGIDVTGMKDAAQEHQFVVIADIMSQPLAPASSRANRYCARRDWRRMPTRRGMPTVLPRRRSWNLGGPSECRAGVRRRS